MVQNRTVPLSKEPATETNKIRTTKPGHLYRRKKQGMNYVTERKNRNLYRLVYVYTQKIGRALCTEADEYAAYGNF